MVQPLDSSHTRFMTVSEVAAVLRVSSMTVYRLINAGQLPAVRIGRSFRVPAEELDGYLAERHTKVG
jgi:excisionase family DNA binding protein